MMFSLGNTEWYFWTWPPSKSELDLYPSMYCMHFHLWHESIDTKSISTAQSVGMSKKVKRANSFADPLNIESRIIIEPLMLFLARSIVFPIRNECFTVTIAYQTFHFVPTSFSVMINLLMATFETSSRKVKFGVHNTSYTITSGFKHKPLLLYQIVPL